MKNEKKYPSFFKGREEKLKILKEKRNYINIIRLLKKENIDTFHIEEIIKIYDEKLKNI